MRPRRILAVAWRDLRLVHAGRGWYRLPSVALGLLLPAGGLPLRLPVPTHEARPAVSGELPDELADALRRDPDARVVMHGGAPIRVSAPAIPRDLRAVLDRLPGPTVLPVKAPARRPLPGRTLIVALLAISLLTGPLSESLPGERNSRTLEGLLSAAISRGELVLGKWLAWTTYGGALAGLSVLTGMLSSALKPGIWPLALPAVVGVAAALGLWLVRGAADEVAGAGVPMRVLPAVALALGALSWWLSADHPALAALIPLGGALGVASGVLGGSMALLLALAGSALLIVPLLAAVTRSLEQTGVAPAQGSSAWILAVLAPPLCWLPIAGPGLWAVAGNPNLILPVEAGLRAAGAMALAAGAVSIARDGAISPRLGDLRGAAIGLGAGIALGLGLAVLGRAGLTLPTPSALAPLADRLLARPGSSDPLTLLLWLTGTTLLFRVALPARAGWPASILAFALAFSPLRPLEGLLLGGGLAWVTTRAGLLPSALAQFLALLLAARLAA